MAGIVRLVFDSLRLLNWVQKENDRKRDIDLGKNGDGGDGDRARTKARRDKKKANLVARRRASRREAGKKSWWISQRYQIGQPT